MPSITQWLKNTQYATYHFLLPPFITGFCSKVGSSSRSPIQKMRFSYTLRRLFSEEIIKIITLWSLRCHANQGKKNV